VAFGGESSSQEDPSKEKERSEENWWPGKTTGRHSFKALTGTAMRPAEKAFLGGYGKEARGV